MKPDVLNTMLLLLFIMGGLFGVLCIIVLNGPEEVTLNNELMLPMQYTNYSNGETWSFKTQDGMPCISYVANNKPGGLSCDWDWRDRDED